MNNSIIKKAKLFFVCALSLILIGLTFFGIFGFNQTVDYKASYELQVSVDQKSGNVLDVVNEATSRYFSENNIKPLSYTTQNLDDCAITIYKFSYDVTSSVDELKVYLQNSIDSESTVSGILADVAVKQVVASDNTNVGKVILAISISLVAIFIIAFIFEKLASAVSIVFTMILSAIMFIAFMGITRLPAAPFITITSVLSMLISGAISAAMVNRYKAEGKKADKLTNIEIVDSVNKNSKHLHLLLASTILLASIALFAFGLPYLMILGTQLLIAGICGISSAIFATPFMWTLIKKKK